MDTQRRQLLKVAGIALLPTVAGCAERSDSAAGGTTDDGGRLTTEDTTTSAPSETGDDTETRSDTDTTTTDEAETSESETDAPTETESTTTTDEAETSESETDAPTETESTTTTEAAVSSDSVTLVLNNVGARAWEVTQDESGSVAPTGENNPTLSFEVGQRYAVENRGWSFHPFAIRTADDTPLLSQSADGQFEGDDAVNWTDDGEMFAFTYTAELAAAADYYICTAHAGMRGNVETA